MAAHGASSWCAPCCPPAVLAAVWRGGGRAPGSGQEDGCVRPSLGRSLAWGQGGGGGMAAGVAHRKAADVGYGGQVCHAVPHGRCCALEPFHCATAPHPPAALPAGKSRGFAFLAYEDQRSTVLSVDNLSGARVAGRVIRVEHVDNYKRKRAEVSCLGCLCCWCCSERSMLLLRYCCWGLHACCCTSAACACRSPAVQPPRRIAGSLIPARPPADGG